MLLCLEEGCTCFHHRLLECMEQGLNDEVEELLQGIKNLGKMTDASGKTLLHYSVEYSNTALLQHLLGSGCEVNAQDHSGVTPMTLAVETANLSAVEILLKNNADIYVYTDSDGASTLQHSFYNNVNLVKLTVGQFFRTFYKVRENHRLILGMFIDKVNEDFSTDKEATATLFFNADCTVKLVAVAFCNIELASVILQNDYTIEFRESKFGFTALHCASILGKFENAELLIERGANIHAVDEAGVTPLMLAVKTGSVTVAEILLNNNADVFVTDSDGVSALQRSLYICVDLRRSSYAKIRRNHRLILEMIAQKVNEDFSADKKTVMKLLLNANSVVKLAVVACCDIELASFILQNDYTVDFRESKLGLTALHCAIILGKLENVKFLIERGANIDTLDEAGYSPLRYYTRRLQYVDEESDVLKTFLKRSSNLYVPDNINITDVGDLLFGGTIEKVRTVLQSGIDIAASLDNYAPLQHVLMRNDYLDVNDITELGITIDVNLRDSSMGCWSALMEAVSHGDISKVGYLLKHGADVNYSSKYEKSMLHWATMYCLSENVQQITELLLQFGAGPQITSGLIDYLLQRSQKERRAIKPIMAHMAMLAAVDKSAMTEPVRNSINAYTLSKSYFDLCSRQLEELKNIVLYETVTLFELLHVSKLTLVTYAHNQELITAFKAAMEKISHFESYYVTTLRRRVAKAVERAKLEEKLAEVVEVLTGVRVDVYHIIVYKIINYLYSQDFAN